MGLRRRLPFFPCVQAAWCGGVGVEAAGFHEDYGAVAITA